MEKNENVVVCAECKREHDIDASTYVRLEGSLYIGKDRGLLNLTKEQPMIMCIPCFIRYIRQIQLDLIEDQKNKIRAIEDTIRILSTSAVEDTMPAIKAPDIPDFMTLALQLL